MATAEIAVTESQQAYLSTPISNATITISEPENRPDDNRGGIADCAAIIEDVPAISPAMSRGAAKAVKARRLPYIRVGVRSLRRRPEDPNDNSRFIEDVTLASSLIDDAVASAIDELYRSPDEFLAKTPSDQLQDARERAMKHAWRLLDARKRSKEVPPILHGSRSTRMRTD